jgi:hypothetical protein
MKSVNKLRQRSSARIKPKYFESIIALIEYLRILRNNSEDGELPRTLVKAIGILNTWAEEPKGVFQKHEVRAALRAVKYLDSPYADDLPTEQLLVGLVRLRKVLRLKRSYFELKEKRALKILQKHLNYKLYPQLKYTSKIDERLAAFRASNPSSSALALVEQSMRLINNWIDLNEALIYGFILNYLKKCNSLRYMIGSDYIQLDDLYGNLYFEVFTILLTFKLDTGVLPITYLLATLKKRAGTLLYLDIPFSNAHEIDKLEANTTPDSLYLPHFQVGQN